MKWTSALAIYLLFWVMSAFFVMPFGMKTADEAGIAKVPGQADSAPANFNARKIILRTTIVATLGFALYYANYVNGWLSVDDINIARLLRPSS
jgi:predicted secreted protein